MVSGWNELSKGLVSSGDLCVLKVQQQIIRRSDS